MTSSPISLLDDLMHLERPVVALFECRSLYFVSSGKHEIPSSIYLSLYRWTQYDAQSSCSSLHYILGVDCRHNFQMNNLEYSESRSTVRGHVSVVLESEQAYTLGLREMIQFSIILSNSDCSMRFTIAICSLGSDYTTSL
jgi:hypothetical protein